MLAKSGASSCGVRNSVIVQMKAAVASRLIEPLEAARAQPYVQTGNCGWVPVLLRSRQGAFDSLMDASVKKVEDGHLRFFAGALSKKMQQESGQF